ncbi:MAG: glycosyltransferase [Halioglobus sp.]|nr:glycosyltransferase [Halioglobus sp.]
MKTRGREAEGGRGIRVLHLGKYFPPTVGGMETYLHDLCLAQSRAGIRCSVLVHEGQLGVRGANERLPAGTGELLVVRAAVWARLVFTPLSPALPFLLGRMLREEQPDILHLHLPNPSAVWALFSRRARRLPWVIHWQSDVVASRHSLGLRLFYRLYRPVERALLQRAARVIATSPPYLQSSAPLTPFREKCRVVPLGLEPLEAPGADQVNTAEGPLRVLAVGRLTYYKGFDYLVRAVASVPGVALHLVGTGDQDARLRRLTRDSGAAERIYFHGHLDDAQLAAQYAACNCLCLPSIERTEAFGLVLLEAMSLGRATVATCIEGSGTGWVVVDGETGLLAPPADAEALAGCLRQLQENRDLRQRLGDNGRDRFHRFFHIDRSAEGVFAIYDEILQSSPPTARRRAREQPPAVNATATASSSGHINSARESPGATDAVAAGSAALRPAVLIPAHNEEESIGGVIRALRRYGNYPVIVIDDCSTDGTAAEAARSGAVVVPLAVQLGAWGATQTGMRYALRHGYNLAIAMDADGQHEPEHLAQLLKPVTDGHAHVSIGSCVERGSRLRRIAWKIMRLTSGIQLEDLTSGFRVYDQRAMRLLASWRASFLDYQDVGVLALLMSSGLRIVSVPVEMARRRHGHSRIFRSWLAVAYYMCHTLLLGLTKWRMRRYRVNADAGR